MYTREEIEKALLLYDQTESVTKVVRKLGYPGRTVMYTWIKGRDNIDELASKRRGPKTGYKNHYASTDTKILAVKRVLEDNEDINDVAKEIGFHPVTIRVWINMYLKEGAASLVNTKNKNKEKPINHNIESEEAETLQAQIEDLRMEVDILKETIEVIKKDPCVDRKALTNSEKAVIVGALRGKYSLPRLLEWLDIPRSSYYYQKKQQNIDKYSELRPTIIKLFNDNNGRYGYRRIHALLKKENITISEKVVRRLMKEENLIVIQRKMPKRFNSYQGEITPAVENLVKRDFHSKQKNQLWLTDISEFAIPAGKAYLSPIVDCFDGYLPSWTIGTSPNAELANTMLDKAYLTLTEKEHPIVHSDRGAHYRWPEWIRRMNEYGLMRSMSKKGCSPDNSACEGLFGRIKNEFFYGRNWNGVSMEEFIKQLNDYLIWYNEKRIKKSLGYLSPMEYRKLMCGNV